MKKLHALAKELKNNNFEMTEGIKEQFEEFLSIIAEGSRVLHPVFGLGTVTNTMGNNFVVVDFDNDNKDHEERLRKYEEDKLNGNNYYYSRPTRHTRGVMIASCTSIHMLIKKEMNRK